MMNLRSIAFTVAVAPTLLACSGGGQTNSDRRDTASNGKAGDGQVVVAVIDSGINPYHSYFRQDGSLYAGQAPDSVSPELLSAFGVEPAHQVDLTLTGDPAADFAADAEIWDSVEPNEVYWFRGTNILAVSMDDGARGILPDDNGDTHGVGTAASVLAANPEAVVLFVEGISNAAESFAFTHPAVDIITTSYGTPGSPPVPVEIEPAGLSSHLNDSYTGVVEMGKLHFGASDNSPAISHTDGTSGPWWTIGVAGWEEGDAEGRQLLSGNLVDFVADFTRDMPYCDICQTEMDTAGGTSFATPYSAGVASKVLLELRRASGHAGGIQRDGQPPAMVDAGGVFLTNWDIRRALELGAYIPSAAEYDPVAGVSALVAVPAIDPAPWLNLGWGLLTALPEKGVVPATLANLGFGDAEPRSKAPEFCTFQAANMEVRRLYWNNLAPGSQSFGAGEDPYIDC